MKKMTKRKMEVIFVGVSIGALFIGFLLGCMFTNYNYFRLVGSLNVDNIIIDFNESQIVDLIYDKVGFDTQGLATQDSYNNNYVVRKGSPKSYS